MFCGDLGKVWVFFSDGLLWDGILQQAENLRVELGRKLNILKGQDAKNEERSSIDKTRAAIDALQTRMSVAIQAVDNCYSQVQKLRDDELYPQLLELLDA